MSGQATCPGCGYVADRVHSRYVRRLTDAGIGGREVRLDLTVRRFFCAGADCARRTFVEQISQLTTRHGRRTVLAADVVQAVAVALGGRPGSRLAGRLAVPVSRMTLLRIIRRLPEDPLLVTPSVLGVDDFAQRRGHRYATILVDMHTHRPVDVLPDRDGDTLAAWLEQHPGVEVICRDRAGAYADGAARGAPDAIQVADRWHLLHNLSEAVHKVVAQHRRCLHPQAGPGPAKTTLESDPVPAATPAQGRRADNTRERHAVVHELTAQGISLKAIARQLHLSRNTVRKYAHARTPDELITANPPRGGGPLEPFMTYLRERHAAGVHDNRVMFDDIRAQGYRGILRTLQRFMIQVRSHHCVPRPLPVPSARQLTGWIMRPDSRLTDEDRDSLAQARAQCPDLDTLVRLTHGFTQLVRGRGGARLETWINEATNSPFPPISGFVAGLHRDYDAVVAGMTHHWSSGAVEGTVNRIKMIKRQMFGRANLDLLRKRVLARP
jgi:transposase